MDPKELSTNTEAELESFRQKWREEVARAKAKRPVSAESANQDLCEKQHGRRLDETSTQTAAALAATREASSALEHYEKAVEKESQGSMGDSVNLYRKAFKLDDKVHETYKAKHFPPSYFKKHPPQPPQPSSTIPASSSATSTAPTSTPKPQDPNPENASVTVPNTAHQSLHALSPDLQTLISSFSSTSIHGEPPPTDLSPAPPSPISTIPEEILVEILQHLAVKDVASFVRLAQVCKRLAYLVITEDGVWKRLSLGQEYGFGAMHYTWSCQMDGSPLSDDEGGFILDTADLNLPDSGDVEPAPEPLSPLSATHLLVPSTYPTYRTLFHRRPRIRFNGCYISTVNYMRPGQSSPTSVSWNSPIHIVTYYRYLRFLRDGTCISLLTTAEPSDVVPYLYTEHMHKNHGALPSAPMKDAVLGRWRMTGPAIPASDSSESEEEGTLVIETAGATPKYMYKLALTLCNAGRGTKNNKLSWQGYWSYNRLTDDWGEFGLKNDRAFYWSRVRSYGMAWDEGATKKKQKENK
ncbi:hypothetical protein EJ02DRAFT_382688 [Clathrospora elynae]|uniref:F-box domain-containing protein n=1 Tax=Clathrospora elynae TaxID=706981 RepID=A0A6A5SK92_9PLEO|nr:hypothetical protein EJ02DRAFT_382688 [Clathrospora elynae]